MRIESTYPSSMKASVDVNNNYIRQSPLSKALLSRVVKSQNFANLPSPKFLTKTKSSWILHLPKWFPPPSPQAFQEIFQNHPKEQHRLKLYGKDVYENRWSQLYVTQSSVGVFYKYSGTSKASVVCNPEIPEEQLVLDLCQVMANQLLEQMMEQGILVDDATHPLTKKKEHGWYNCCLVNWYQPQHTIGLHADDEMQMDTTIPIVSLSWGGPRRFLLRPKPTSVSISWSPCHDILLQSGDVIVMGGRCQEEFKHEIPKVRKMDGLVVDRISWTIRSMKPASHSSKATTKKRKMESIGKSL